MRTLTLLALAALLLAAPASGQRVEVAFPEGIDAETRELLNQATSHLFRVCPGISQFWSKVRYARVSIDFFPEQQGPGVHVREIHGLDRRIAWRIRFNPEGPEGVPWGEWVHIGQLLSFFGGAGTEAGIWIDHPGARLLCKLPPTFSRKESFIPVPELALIDKIREPPRP